SEVEWRDGVHEPFERAIVEVIPYPGDRQRLLGVDPLGVVDVEAEEVDQLTGGIDLRLMHGLRLPEHCGRVDDGPVARGEEIRGLEKDRGPPLEPPRRPFPPGRLRGGDGRPYLVGTGLLHFGEDVTVDVAMPHCHHHILAKVQQAGPDEVRAAIAAAQAAWREWAAWGSERRAVGVPAAAGLPPTGSR